MATPNIKNVEEEDNLFDRLPDHVLHYILNKVVDGKSLLRCLTVCKRFASIRGLISSATLRVDNHREKINGFIRRFNAIKSLHVEIPSLCCCRENDSTSSEGECMINWKVGFSSRFDNFVMLYSTSLQPMKEEEEEEEGEEKKLDDNHEEEEAASATPNWLGLVLSNHIQSTIHILSRLEDEIHSPNIIRNMVITDLKEKGKIIFERQSFIESNNSSYLPGKKKKSRRLLLRACCVPVYVKLWYMPLLRLTSSGYEMKDAHLGMIRRCESESDIDDDYDNDNNSNSNDDNEDHILLASAFQDKVSKEAVAQILKNKSATNWGKHQHFLAWSDRMMMPNFNLYK